MSADTRECPNCLDTASVAVAFVQYEKDGTAQAKLKCFGCGKIWFEHFNGTGWLPMRGVDDE